MTDTPRISRFSLSDYKSIGSISLDFDPSLRVLVGKNGIGKTNIFDGLALLRDACGGFLNAIGNRGNIEDLLAGKRNSKANISTTIDIPQKSQARRNAIHRLIYQEGQPMDRNLDTAVESLAESNFMTQLHYTLEFNRDEHVERLVASPFNPQEEEVLLCVLEVRRHSAEARCIKPNPLIALTRTEQRVVPSSEYIKQNPPMQNMHELMLSGQGIINEPIRLVVELLQTALKDTVWLRIERSSEPRQAMESSEKLDDRATNLVRVLLHLRTNHEVAFDRLRRELGQCIPDLDTLSTPTSGSHVTVAVSDKASNQTKYTFSHMSYGTRNVLSIGVALASSPDGATVMIEEPEAFLHPDAQLKLFRFIRSQSKRVNVLLSTHSSVMAGAAACDELLLVLRDDKNKTVVETMSEATIPHVCDELGLRPSFNLDSDAFVFCEGKIDVAIMNTLRNRFYPELKVQFIDAEGWKSMQYYANARIARTGPIKRHVFVLFDGDTDSSEHKRAKEKLVNKVDLPPNQIITLPVPEIDEYLLNSHALIKAFPQIRSSPIELDKRIGELRKDNDPKEALKQILCRNSCGSYTDECATRIASVFDEVPADLETVFKAVSAKVEC